MSGHSGGSTNTGCNRDILRTRVFTYSTSVTGMNGIGVREACLCCVSACSFIYEVRLRLNQERCAGRKGCSELVLKIYKV